LYARDVWLCHQVMQKKARRSDSAGLLRFASAYQDSIRRPANRISTTPMVRSNQCPMRMNSRRTLLFEKNSATITNHNAFTKHIHKP